MNFKSKNHGMTLTETSIVVMVASLILAISLASVRVLDSFSVDKDAFFVTETSRHLKKSSLALDGYFNVDINYLANFNFIPDYMMKSGVARSAFGGLVTVSPVALWSANPLQPKGLEISFADMPKQACIEMVPRVEGDLYSVKINGALIKGPSTPYSAAALAVACNLASTHTLTFTIAHIDFACRTNPSVHCS